ncbi:MAG TPA: hypothetical protein VFO52_01910 [Longimicrobiales bacterium]|nr:hypothetical protein [Longimicrobiales bacterium]
MFELSRDGQARIPVAAGAASEAAMAAVPVAPPAPRVIPEPASAPVEVSRPILMESPPPAAMRAAPSAAVAPAPETGAPAAAAAKPVPAPATVGPPAPAAEAAPKPTKRPSFRNQDPAARAQRLARALVSDIVAYNKEKLKQSTGAAALRAEFREEIRKSWEEYVEQVGLDVAKTTPYFRDALNEILAKGEKVF